MKTKEYDFENPKDLETLFRKIFDNIIALQKLDSEIIKCLDESYIMDRLDNLNERLEELENKMKTKNKNFVFKTKWNEDGTLVIPTEVPVQENDEVLISIQ